MKKYVKPLVLVGLLGGASLAVALADAPARSQAGTAAQREGRSAGMGPWVAERLLRHSQELGLTAQQLESIKAAEQAARPELDKLTQALRQRQEALRTQIDGILTAEQRTKLQEMRGAMWGHRGHHGPEDPPPSQGNSPTK